MAQSVIAVYGVKYESFLIEYFEEHTKEWLIAVGKFPSGMSVQGFYKDEDAAKVVAQQLAKAENKVVRVIKEENK